MKTKVLTVLHIIILALAIGTVALCTVQRMEIARLNKEAKPLKARLDMCENINYTKSNSCSLDCPACSGVINPDFVCSDEREKLKYIKEMMNNDFWEPPGMEYTSFATGTVEKKQKATIKKPSDAQKSLDKDRMKISHATESYEIPIRGECIMTDPIGPCRTLYRNKKTGEETWKEEPGW